jgi:small subunit ribosomal protein S4
MPPNNQQQSGRRPKPKSRFGTQLEEKQNLKSIYGIRENQLKIYFKAAQKAPDETGPKLIETLEKRLDNAIYRAGIAETRAQARQMSSHSLFEVNGRPVNIPSIQLKIGDKVRVKECKKGKAYFTNFEKKMQNAQVASWLELNIKEFEFKIIKLPTIDEAGIGVSVQEIVELLAR